MNRPRFGVHCSAHQHRIGPSAAEDLTSSELRQCLLPTGTLSILYVFQSACRFSEGKGAVPINLSLEAIFANQFFDNVYLAAKNFG